MRVLCTTDEKKKMVAVFQIIEIGYCDDMICANVLEECIAGLYIITNTGERLCYKDISIEECTNICEEIVNKGFYDFRKYGMYEIY